MTLTWFEEIRLPYLGPGGRRVVGQARRHGRVVGVPHLSDHLLHDIGLLDGRQTQPCSTELPASARDLVERYR